MIVVGFALLVIEQQTDYALLIDWPRRRGCFTLEADELLIEAELLTLTTTKSDRDSPYQPTTRVNIR